MQVLSRPNCIQLFFDIEVDFDPLRGYSRPEDPFNPITAISVYLDWLDKMVTLVIPPKSYSWETAQEICNKYENCFLFEREADLLDSFLKLSALNLEKILYRLIENLKKSVCIWLHQLEYFIEKVKVKDEL